MVKTWGGSVGVLLVYWAIILNVLVYRFLDEMCTLIVSSFYSMLVWPTFVIRRVAIYSNDQNKDFPRYDARTSTSSAIIVVNPLDSYS